MSAGRRAVVTGGAGFIGRHLARELLDRDWLVSIVDDFSAGRRTDVAALADHPGCRIVEADVADADAVRAAIAAAHPTTVFHLAAVHFIPQCEQDPLTAIRTNVLGTQSVLQALEAEAGCRIVFASTADVYAPSAQPHTEESAIAPVTLYGITKAAGENLVRYAGARGGDYRIARLFNVFGPGDRTPHVLPDIVNGLAMHGELALGRLDAVRDYVYLDDVVRALIVLAEHQGGERIFNIGTGEGRSVRDLVDAISTVRGFPVSVRSDPAKVRAVERATLVCDPRLAQRVLAWVPRTTLDQGLKRMLTAAAPYAEGDPV